MSFTPSVRECLDRLRTMLNTPALAGELTDLAAELERGGAAWPELHTAAQRLGKLWELAQHMAANLGAGAAVPPPPAPKPQPVRKPERPGGTPAHIARPAAPALPAAAELLPEALVDIDEITRRLNRSSPWLYVEMKERRFPRPTVQRGKRKYWVRRDIEPLLVGKGPREMRRG